MTLGEYVKAMIEETRADLDGPDRFSQILRLNRLKTVLRLLGQARLLDRQIDN